MEQTEASRHDARQKIEITERISTVLLPSVLKIRADISLNTILLISDTLQGSVD